MVRWTESFANGMLRNERCIYVNDILLCDRCAFIGIKRTIINLAAVWVEHVPVGMFNEKFKSSTVDFKTKIL